MAVEKVQMNKRIFFISLVLVMCAAVTACAENRTVTVFQTGTSAAAPTAVAALGQKHQVSIKGSAFVPLEVRVKPGDSVTWVNQDARPHTVTSIRYFQDEDEISHVYIGEIFDSGDIAQGQSYTRTFTEAGAFWYFSFPLNNALPIPEYLQLVQELSVGSVVVD
jgi:plastocyanin